MDPRFVSLIIVSCTMGLLGAVVGTYVSVRNTAGPRERAFMLKMAALGWTFIVAFLLSLWFVPRPFWPLLHIPQALMFSLLPWWIRHANQRQGQIQQEEAAAGETFTARNQFRL